MSHTVTKSNTLSTVAFKLRQGGKPVSLSGLTVKVFGKTDAYAAWIAETTVTAEPAFTFTASATTDLLTHAGHKVEDGDEITVSNSGGGLPGGLVTATRYFAVQVTANAFGLATTPGGVPIDLTSAGTGTNSYVIVGLVPYDWQTADLATAGQFRMYVNVYSGAEYDTFPTVKDGARNPGFRIYIVEPA